MKFDVVINTDDKYLQHCMAMLCSLYENNAVHEITLHVLQKHLSDESKEYIEGLTSKYQNHVFFYEMDETPLQGVQFRKNRPLSMAAYYRLLLSSVLPQEVDKVLYLDCDIIVLRDISEIFCIELDDYALAASIDYFPYSQQHRLQLHMEADERTFCSGVMLVNLNYWRNHNVESGLLEYAKRKRNVVYLHDQDVLNYYFKKKWFLLPPKWNRTANKLRAQRLQWCKKFDYKEYAFEPILIHYASVGIKPWYNAPVPERRSYEEYLQKSGFRNIVYEKKSLIDIVSLFFITANYEFKKLILYITKCY